MYRHTFKTTMSEGGGVKNISATLTVFPSSVMKKYARVFGLSQLVLLGVVRSVQYSLDHYFGVIVE